MPQLDVISVDEAKRNTATGRRAETLQEYLGYIGHLGNDQAGKLTPSWGETTATVRRRLGAAAKALGKAVVIKRKGDEIYFWVETQRRRGRRRQTPL